MCYRHLSYLCLIVCGGLLLVSAYIFLEDIQLPIGPVVEGSDRVLKEIVVGRDYVLDFRLSNPMDHPLRVVGVEYT